MTRYTIVTAALAGLTTVASAQTVGTVTLTASAATIGLGETFTIGVVLSDNISGNSVIAFDLMVEGFGPGIVFMAGDPTPDPGVFGFAGSASGNSVTGLGGSSDILGPDLDPSLDGVTVFTFQVEIGPLATGQLTFSASEGLGPNEALQWGKPGIVFLPANYDLIVFNSVSILVLPAPGTVPLLAAAGLLAMRRRRGN